MCNQMYVLFSDTIFVGNVSLFTLYSINMKDFKIVKKFINGRFNYIGLLIKLVIMAIIEMKCFVKF